ncbi:PREDICTED: superoxide dismutase [Cu-Zn]-like [Papilio polytes]|uniref:superoxide dismutase [Cu-Zn]-like n=1 Tax=Papilio polytes TaxID=76194 RepID=UPI0006760530|nr:PREDICTED: superoxide dismutase [Cu-Zn]-like [Papilio polytes]
MYARVFSFLVVISLAVQVRSETRVAIAHLISQNVTGSITFTETANGIRVSGTITGLDVGKYGFHVHELGDTSTCDAAGAHFDPDDNTHGGRDHAVRHVGDLGNVQFVGTENPVANVDFVDNVISLRGRNSIIGRTLVLHEQEDDLGLGGNEGSLNTGNAGPRIGCGVIGIRSPSGPWNSSASVFPSLFLLTLTAAFVIGK